MYSQGFKILKIVFLLIIAQSTLFATTYVDEFPVYVAGDVKAMATIFESIIRVISADDFQNGLIPMVALFSIWMAAKALFVGNTNGFFKSITVLMFGSMMLVYEVPSSGVGVNSLMGVSAKIIDTRANYGTSVLDTGTVGYSAYTSVDNVPYLLLAPISLSTTFSYGMTKVIEDSFSSVNSSLGASAAGFMGESQLVRKALNAANNTNDPEVEAYLEKYKQFIGQCYIDYKVNADYALVNTLINPGGALIDLVKANNYIPSEYMDDGTPCSDVKSELVQDYPAIVTKIGERAKKLTAPFDVTSSSFAGVVKDNYLANLEVNASSSANGFLNFLAEAPIMAATMQALQTHAKVSELPQDMAITAAATKSLTSLQFEGIGQWRWLVEIFPFYVHFMRGVIYAIGIFILLIVMGAGWEKGVPIYLNYVKGLVVFETTVISFSLIDGLIDFYASQNAPNQLFAAGENPVSISNIGSYLSYVATMEGTAGVIGLFALISIPGMIYSGSVANAMSGLSSLAGQYKGNAAGTLKDDGAKAAESRRAIGNMSPAMVERLKKAGIEKPQGVADLDFASQIMAEVGGAAKKLADLNTMNLKNDISESTYANARTDIGKSISGGRGRLQSGEIQLDGDMSLAASEEYRVRAKQESSGVVTAGQQLNGSSTLEVNDPIKDSDGKIIGYQKKNISNPMLEENRVSSFVNTAINNLQKSSLEGQQLQTQGLVVGGNVTSLGTTANNLQATKQALASKETAERVTLGEVATLAKDAAVQESAKARGLQTAQVYDADGNTSTEFNKYTLGLEGQNRLGINKGALAMGAALASISDADRKQAMADVEANAAGKQVMEFSEAKGGRTNFNVSHSENGFISGVTADKKINIPGKGSITMAQAAESLAEASMDSMAGKGAGVRENLKKNPSIYASNAMTSELSQQQTMATKIKTQGGIDGAVAADVVDSGLKANDQLSAQAGRISAAAEKTGGDATQIRNQLIEGGAAAGKEFGEQAKAALKELGKNTQEMAQGKQTADFTTVKTANEMFADKGGYVGFQAKSAEYNTAESAGGLSKKVDMLEDQTRMNNMMQGLAKEGVQIKDFMQDGATAKTGATMAAAMAGNRVKKFNMKDSLVSDSGAAIDFAMDDEGRIGKFSSDAVNSHSLGKVINNHRELPASMTAFNALHHRNKDMQVGLDERGQFTGTPEAIKAFEEHYKHKQHTEAAARGILGEFGGTLMDAASGITSEEMAELGMLGAVGAVAGKKLLWDPIDPLGSRSKKQNSNQLDSNGENPNSKKSNPETHGNTPKENYDNAQTQINESRANLSNYTQEVVRLQGNNEALNEKIYKANNNPKLTDAERASTLEPLYEQREANNARISSLNQSIYDENIALEHRKNAAAEALNHPDFGKEPKGRIGRIMEAAGNISSNAWESIQTRAGSMDEILDNFQSGAKNLLADAKGLPVTALKGLGLGMVVDTAAGEASQYLVDNGHYRSANIAHGIGNITNSFFDGSLGVASLALGSVDATTNALFGSRPLGEFTQSIGLTKGNDLIETGKQLFNDGGDKMASGWVNIADAGRGTQNVYGVEYGASTSMGDLLGYGSLSQQIGAQPNPQHNASMAQEIATQIQNQPAAYSAPGNSGNAEVMQQMNQVVGMSKESLFQAQEMSSFMQDQFTALRKELLPEKS